MDSSLSKIKQQEQKTAYSWTRLLALFLTITLLSHGLPAMGACCQSMKAVSEVEVKTSDECPFHKLGQGSSAVKKNAGFTATKSDKKANSGQGPMCHGLCCVTFSLSFSQDQRPNFSPQVLKRTFIPLQVSMIKDVVVLPWRPPLPQFIS